MDALHGNDQLDVSRNLKQSPGGALWKKCSEKFREFSFWRNL